VQAKTLNHADVGRGHEGERYDLELVQCPVRVLAHALQLPDNRARRFTPDFRVDSNRHLRGLSGLREGIPVRLARNENRFVSGPSQSYWRSRGQEVA